MITDKAEIAKILQDSEYMGGINGDIDDYQFMDHTRDIWIIHVDCHNDDGNELTNDEIIGHAIGAERL